MEWSLLGEDPDLDYTCVGINHMAFFLRLASGNRDLYPALLKASKVPALRRLDPVRFELFDQLGYFMTETSGHMSEYVPWFLRHEAEVKRLELRPSAYIDTCAQQEDAYRTLRQTLLNGTPVLDSTYSPSVEYVSRIMNAVTTGESYVFNGNVHNRGGALISNLPGDSCVEVPCVANRDGVTYGAGRASSTVRRPHPYKH